MKTLKKVVLLLFVMAGLASCLDDKEPVLSLYIEPAVVVYDGSKAKIETGYGRFTLPTTKDPLYPGDYLLVNGTVDFGNQPIPNDTVISNFSYKKLGGDVVRFRTGNMEDNYTDSISAMDVYPWTFGNVLFFYFEHKARKDDTFEYEIICNTDSIITVEGKSLPKLYIKSRKKNSSESGNIITIGESFVFDMTPYVSEYKKSGELLNLYVHYKNKTKNGEDIYKKYERYYPIEWRLE
ncbi:MAG: hypothetical protein LUG18_06645 [Candidatus Azobacteroides sp.]|nr:hypothetical protein [Candidatus Azobacteroides sp.]